MLTKKDVFPGARVRIEIDGVFDGYVRLIEPDGEEFAQMETDLGPVYVTRRWLVQFTEEPDLVGAERFTQIAQKQRQTHRVIKYKVGNFSKVYKKYSYREPTQPNGDLLWDSFVMDCY